MKTIARLTFELVQYFSRLQGRKISCPSHALQDAKRQKARAQMGEDKKGNKNIQQRVFASGHPPDY
jgi:hypothetical protein